MGNCCETEPPSFQSFISAIRKRDVSTVKDNLAFFGVDATKLKQVLEQQDDSGRTPLIHACECLGTDSILELLLAKMVIKDKSDILKSKLLLDTSVVDKQFAKKHPEKQALQQNVLTVVCLNSFSADEIEAVIAKIVQATGGCQLLIDNVKKAPQSPFGAVLTHAHGEPAPIRFFASLLFVLGMFKEEYHRMCGDFDQKVYRYKQTLDEIGIKNASWTPTADEVDRVKTLLGPKNLAEIEAKKKEKHDDEATAKNIKVKEAGTLPAAAASRQTSNNDDEQQHKQTGGTAKNKHINKSESTTNVAPEKKVEKEGHIVDSIEKTGVASATESKAAGAARKRKPPPTDAEDQQPHDDSTTTISANSTPPARCFKRGVPDKNLEDAVRALFSIKEAPSNRPDLQNWIPDKNDAGDLLHYLKCCLDELKKRPTIQKLISENHLTDDDIKILHSYKIQNPYPVYLWLNGWLGGDRRDDFVKEHVAPFFTILYRAMEKLPRIKTVADRAIKVNGIPALKNTFENFKVVCAPKSILSFWGFSSFSTADDVVNREEFVGKLSEPAIVYSCGELEGVDMEPFAPQGLKSESEILPLCPCVLEVTTAVKMGQKLIVGVKQLNHADFSYVAPK